MRIGLGFDSHFLKRKRGIITLGGVKIQSKFSVVAHSDGDVIAHALIDAIAPLYLGSSIGELYSDKDESARGSDSMKRLKDVYVKASSPEIINIDIVVQTDDVYIASIADAIKRNIACCFGIEPSAVGIKGKTLEGLRARWLWGGGHSIRVYAVVLAR